MVMEDGSVTNVRMVSLFMHHVPMCCSMITNISIMTDILTKVI